MNKKKIVIILAVGLCVLFGAGFGIYKYKTHKIDTQNKVTETTTNNTEENDNVAYSDDINDVSLTDDQREEFMKIYNKEISTLTQKVKVSDAEIDKYLEDHNNKVQYPSYKLICIDNKTKKEQTYYSEDDSIATLKEGDVSSYGEVKSVSSLDDNDKREVVRTIVQSNKIANTILREMGQK